MIEFIKSYWPFIIAGIILVALFVYLITESVLAKKRKSKKAEMAADDEVKEEVVVTPVEEPVEKEPVEKSLEEVQPTNDEAGVVNDEEKQKAMGAYMISYDKAKKDWVIKRKGAQRATKRTKTKKEALEIVKSLTETQDVGYVVKKKDGKFQKK